ncbi:hypothetical protein SAMN06265373_101304 [Shimia sagamensis]|uniref:Uncharacterized protein n=1 Tax=Shimia sagamensis TaxID=1566352 RepID=A0ABY1N7U4_9RHOB|nr:hypothetical protein SAMN06265373_101304 [Shimia sagamensis]
MGNVTSIYIGLEFNLVRVLQMCMAKERGRRHAPAFREVLAALSRGQNQVWSYAGLTNDVEVRPIGVAGDILIAILVDHQDVMFAIAARTGLTVRNGQHRLHGNHHAGL